LRNNIINIIPKFSVAIFFILASLVCNAQVKVSATASVANPNAILEIESTNKGLLLPRLALVSTTLAAPLTNFVKGMVVFDTVTINDITPGMYYSDGTKWIKMGAEGSVGGGGTPVASVQKKMEVVATAGQTIFTTPANITDGNKIFLYRNGVMISFTVSGLNTIVAEVASMQNDEIRIIQFL
jgi:hypothetical protein